MMMNLLIGENDGGVEWANVGRHYEDTMKISHENAAVRTTQEPTSQFNHEKKQNDGGVKWTNVGRHYQDTMKIFR